MKQQGKCLCGNVQFEAEFTKTEMHACHCTMCRAWSSSPLFAIDVDQVSFKSESSIGRYASSEWADRGFCKDCGSSLFYHLKEADHYLLCCGLFEDQSAFKLSGEIFIDECPGGYAFAGDHPRHTGEEFMAMMQSAEPGEPA